MSADRYVICPKCKHVDPDAEYGPEDEFAGSVRIDHEFYNEHPSLDLKVRVNFSCGECGWHKKLTEADLELT